MEPTMENLVLDPLAVLYQDNQLYICCATFYLFVLQPLFEGNVLELPNWLCCCTSLTRLFFLLFSFFFIFFLLILIPRRTNFIVSWIVNNILINFIDQRQQLISGLSKYKIGHYCTIAITLLNRYTESPHGLFWIILCNFKGSKDPALVA